MADPDYPGAICSACGQVHGRRSPGIATWSRGRCDICGGLDWLTEPRDFGHLRDSWKAAAQEGVIRAPRCAP